MHMGEQILAIYRKPKRTYQKKDEENSNSEERHCSNLLYGSSGKCECYNPLYESMKLMKHSQKVCLQPVRCYTHQLLPLNCRQANICNSCNFNQRVEHVYRAERSVNVDTFCDFIEKFLLPVLMLINGSNPHSIVVVDSGSIHHIDKVIQLVGGVGALLQLLLPYSPDLYPIEPCSCCFSKYCTHYLITCRLNY